MYLCDDPDCQICKRGAFTVVTQYLADVNDKTVKVVVGGGGGGPGITSFGPVSSGGGAGGASFGSYAKINWPKDEIQSVAPTPGKALDPKITHNNLGMPVSVEGNLMDLTARIKYNDQQGHWEVLWHGKIITKAFKSSAEAHQYLQDLKSGKEKA